MRILFCNIAWMDYQQGIIPGKDEPKNGGAFVKENNDAHEKYNFQSAYLTEKQAGYPDGEYCIGFVEKKSTNGKTINQLNIEKIEGCAALKKEQEVDDVLVVYCAKYPDSFANETYVVGWYKHATVYRNYAQINFENEDGTVYEQFYNAIAREEDCTLLPRSLRRKSNTWRVPRKQRGISYGFGQANVWYAQGSDDNPDLKRFLDRIVSLIESYDGENWVDALNKEQIV